jgi:acyl carrier protein
MEQININSVNEKIRNFILNAIKIPDLKDDDNLFETGIVNSLFAVQMMTFLEKTFNIQVTTDDLLIENFQSIDSATSFVLQKQSM